MLRFALGVLGLFTLGSACFVLPDLTGATSTIGLLLAWPVLCGVGLIAGANLGSYLDRLPSAHRQPGAAPRRGWLIRCLGLVQGSVSAALLVAVAWIFPSAEVYRQALGLGVALPALLLVALSAWLLLVKSWFELLTGSQFQEWPSFWRGLSPGGKLMWVSGYYGASALLLLLPELLLMRLVTGD